MPRHKYSSKKLFKSKLSDDKAILSHLPWNKNWPNLHDFCSNGGPGPDCWCSQLQCPRSRFVTLRNLARCTSMLHVYFTTFGRIMLWGCIFFKFTIFQREWAVRANMRAHLPTCHWVHIPQGLLLSPLPLPQLSNFPGNGVRKGRRTVFLGQSHVNARKSNWTSIFFYYLKSPIP